MILSAVTVFHGSMRALSDCDPLRSPSVINYRKFDCMLGFSWLNSGLFLDDGGTGGEG